MSRKLLEVKNLTKTYCEGAIENRAVDHVSLEVDLGEFVVLMGASGSGKTSLLHLLAGIDDFNEGTVEYTQRAGGLRPSRYTQGHTVMHALRAGGLRPSRYTQGHTDMANPFMTGVVDFGRMKEKEKSLFRRENLGIVFQQQCLIPDLTVCENIMLPLMLAQPRGGNESRTSRKDRVLGLCARFGLEEHADKIPSRLSGGQQQRAAILRAIVNKPPLLLCDEPTGSLNLAQTQLVMELLSELNQDGQTILLVTHDIRVAARGSRVIYIEDGRVAGELRFARPDALDVEASDKEQRLMDFLKERGW